MQNLEQENIKSTGHSDSDYEFFKYYSEQSLTPAAIQRFESIRNIVQLKLREEQPNAAQQLDVLDVGCNAGTQCKMWAEDGHRVHGIDVNELLLELAAERARESGFDIDYVLGTAAKLPWADESMDVCLVPELLEHVADWRPCLDEFARVLKPNGVIYLSTTNYLCPKQQEFTLPMYSWYPSFVKDRYERLAMSTRPELANYAKYPAVNWFTFYSLRGEFSVRGLDSYDRFDLVDEQGKSAIMRFALSVIRNVAPLRLLGHIATPYTVIVGTKRSVARRD